MIQDVEQLDHFFVAYNTNSYRILTSLLLQEKPREKSYHQLVELLKRQYDPRPSVIIKGLNSIA